MILRRLDTCPPSNRVVVWYKTLVAQDLFSTMLIVDGSQHAHFDTWSKPTVKQAMSSPFEIEGCSQRVNLMSSGACDRDLYSLLWISEIFVNDFKCLFDSTRNCTMFITCSIRYTTAVGFPASILDLLIRTCTQGLKVLNM